MKICTNCFREFDEKEILESSPAADLADNALQDIGIDDVNDRCPDCREDLGVMTLLGLGQ
jgi:hypothetical protein